jgi:HlyD family secretion protein
MKLLEAGARAEEIDVARSLLEEAKASERLARQNWERTRQLVDAGVISQNDVDLAWKEFEAVQSRAAAAREQLAITLNRTRAEELEAARAELKQREHELAVAQAEFEKTVLRAPITGTIIRKHMKVGEAVSTFQPSPVVTVADLRELRVRAEVDEIDLAKVRLGQEVELEILAQPGTALRGKVIRLGKSMGRKKVPSNDPNEREDVRVLEVLIAVEEAKELPLGLRVTVSFLAGAGAPPR